ncbi:hypothetical protein Trydic_g5691 [Trypoxylus dichotomus]
MAQEAHSFSKECSLDHDVSSHALDSSEVVPRIEPDINLVFHTGQTTRSKEAKFRFITPQHFCFVFHYSGSTQATSGSVVRCLRLVMHVQFGRNANVLRELLLDILTC